MERDDRIDAAIAELDNSKVVNYAATARKYNIDRTTLSKRHRGKTRSRAEFLSDELQLLTTAEEAALCAYMEALSKRGLHLTPAMTKTIAEERVRHEISKNWIYGFLERNSEDLTSIYLHDFDRKRHLADSVVNISQFYEIVSNFN